MSHRQTSIPDRESKFDGAWGTLYADTHTRHRISDTGYRISIQDTDTTYSIQIQVQDTGTDVIYWILDAATGTGNYRGCNVEQPRPHGGALPYRGVQCRTSPYYLPVWWALAVGGANAAVISTANGYNAKPKIADRGRAIALTWIVSWLTI